MFRKKQLNRVDQVLWNKLVEALTGFELNSTGSALTTVAVPSLERQLYDAQFGTDTRFGIRDDEAFTDKDISIATVIAVITDVDFDTTPIDKEFFFASYSFDTPENTKIALDFIYNGFSIEAINKIYFEVLFDAFSVKSKYKDIMKTSFISVTGIRLLQSSGSPLDDL